MSFQPIRRVVAAAALLVAASLPAHALVFDLTFLDGTSPAAEAAFQSAADTWSQLLTDNITVTLTVGTSSILGSGVLASTASNQVNATYTQVATALIADATSATDATVVANLPLGASVPLLVNYTSDNPHGAGSATPYLDNNGSANNTTIRMTSANARALGLSGPLGSLAGCIGPCDGYIAFSTAYTYDYDPSNGITAGAFDFTGLAEHEIAHALGFISGVDVVDNNSPNGSTFYTADQLDYLSPLDLFRCSAATANSSTRDFTAGNTTKFFSIDGCKTADLGATFSTGLVHGDGNQASHWKQGQTVGLMDPNAAPGQALAIAPLDQQALDAIGYNLATVPEPASLLLLGAGLVGLAGARRRRFPAG